MPSYGIVITIGWKFSVCSFIMAENTVMVIIFQTVTQLTLNLDTYFMVT